MKTFDFSEALSFIKAGMTVSLTINETPRTYHLNQNGDIICIPNGKVHLAYKVTTFHVDAIMSNDWRLTDETNEK